MRLLNRLKKTIIPFLGILLAIFLLGCGQRIVNNQTDNQFDGIWEMEYSTCMITIGTPENPGDLVSITMRSVLTFEADSFNLQIIAPNRLQYYNKEYAGNYSISADTIIFNATYRLSFNMFNTNDSISNNEFDLIENLQFNFKNHDSLTFNVISIAISDSMFSIPMGSFLWSSIDLGYSFKGSGTYARIDL